jgi:hypothetical protein
MVRGETCMTTSLVHGAVGRMGAEVVEGAEPPTQM